MERLAGAQKQAQDTRFRDTAVRKPMTGAGRALHPSGQLKPPRGQKGRDHTRPRTWRGKGTIHVLVDTGGPTRGRWLDGGAAGLAAVTSLPSGDLLSAPHGILYYDKLGLRR